MPALARLAEFNVSMPVSPRLLLVLLGCALTRLTFAAICPIPGDTLLVDDFEVSNRVSRYVATTGSNAAAGTYAAPWKTLSYAVDHANPGDTVCARAGLYNEVVELTRSGNVSAGPIVLRSFPGETAIVDGTGLGVPNGQWGLVTAIDQSFVGVRGLEIRNFRTTSTSLVPIGIYVSGAGTDIALTSNHIHDIANTGAGCAANAFGLKVDGSAAPASIRNLLVGNNELDHLTLGCSESLSLDGNVEFWTISDNRVHDTNNIGIGAIGFEGVSPNASFDQARDGVIRGNEVWNITSFGNPAYGNQYAADGIYVDGGTRILIERNRIHHVDLGIELASEHSGRTTSNVTARNNLVYFGNSAGISIGGYDNSVGGTTACDIVNNTLLYNDRIATGSGELQIQYHASNNRFANNLVVADTQGLLLNAYTNEAGTPATLDYNLYFSKTGGDPPSWIWKGVSRASLTALRNASSQELHGNYADPQLVNTATPDLHVPATSPAVGAGTNLGAAVVGELDFDANPRVQGAMIDAGAYER
ncbi:MAG: right-handed parallel beta-helix repeat-containing protein [Tahibacter sp.]